MRYPPEFLELLRSRATVSEVVGKRIDIKRKGREFSGLCPFHKEDTPSFTVNDAKGFYHCFGCGAHGDAIGFIKDYESVSYKEAIERLANELGVVLPVVSKAQEARYKHVNSLHDVMEWACGWFEGRLADNAGAHCRDYIQKRGISATISQRFRLGYAPANRQALKEFLIKKGATDQQLQESGLLIYIENKEPYSRFRDRLIFPIRNRRGQVIAFGGRLLRADPNSRAPKYLNSPETPLFHKGHTLYNIDHAQQTAARRDGETPRIIVCEGYTDVIALAQAGIEGAVAPLGTALTVEQIQLLWKLTDAPIICLDGDNAGVRAMYRATELVLPLLTPGKILRFLQLPQGEDPDTLVRQQGREAALRIFEESLTLSEVLLQKALKSSDNSPDGRAKAEAMLMQQVDAIENATVKHYYRDYFRTQLRPQYGKSNHSHKSGIEIKVQSPKDNMAQQALALIMLVPSLLEESEVEEGIVRIHTTHPQTQALKEALIGMEGKDSSVSSYLFEQDAQLADWAQAMLTRHKVGFPAILQHANKENGDYNHIALRCWKYIMASYDLIQIEQECTQAEQQMSAQMDANNFEIYQRLMLQRQALKTQKDMLLMQHSLDAEVN